MDVGQSVYTPSKLDVGKPYTRSPKLRTHQEDKLGKGEVEETRLARVIGDSVAKVERNEDGGLSSDKIREDQHSLAQRKAVRAALVATLTELTETLNDLVERQFGAEAGTVIEGKAVAVGPKMAPAPTTNLAEATFAGAKVGAAELAALE